MTRASGSPPSLSPEQRREAVNAIAERFRAALKEGNVAGLEALRQTAKSYGLTEDVGAVCGDLFTLGALPGRQPIENGPSPRLDENEVAFIRMSELKKLPPEPIVFRFLNAGGETEVVVGTLKSIQSAQDDHSALLTFESFDPDAAERVRQEHEIFRAPLGRSISIGKSAPHRGVLSASPLPPLAPPTGRPKLMPRSRIPPIARSMEDGTYKCPFHLEHPAAYVLIDSKTDRIKTVEAHPGQHAVFDPALVAGIKTHRNAAVAVLTQALSERAFGGKPAIDIDLEKIKASGDVYSALEIAYREALNAHSLEVSHTPAHDELKKLLDFTEKHLGLERTPNRTTVEKFMASGIHTAADVLSNLSRVLFEVYERQFGEKPASGKELADIFRQSATLIVQLAGTDLVTLSNLQREIVENEHSTRWKSEPFEIKETGAGKMLAFKPAAKDVLKKKLGAWLDTPLRTTTGCPALVSTKPGEKHLIAALVESFAVHLEKVYQHEIDKTIRG